MAFLRTITNVFKRVSSKTLVGADKEGNKFFTYEDPNGMLYYVCDRINGDTSKEIN
jgi:hypothetical protein